MTKSRNDAFPRVDGDGRDSCCQELKVRSSDWLRDDVSSGCRHLGASARFAAGGSLLSLSLHVADSHSSAVAGSESSALAAPPVLLDARGIWILPPE